MTSTSDWARSSSSRQVLIRFKGDVDLDTAPHLRRALTYDVHGSDGPVLLDLSGVTFMDCTGLGILLEAKADLGDRLWLCGVTPGIAQLMRLTGLLARFGVADDVAAAERRDTAAALHAATTTPVGTGTTAPERTVEQRAAEGQARIMGKTRVDEARGLLMATYGCDAEGAWQMLFRASRAQGREVHVLTDALIDAAQGRSADQTSIEMMAALDAILTPEPHVSRRATPLAP